METKVFFAEAHKISESGSSHKFFLMTEKREDQIAYIAKICGVEPIKATNGKLKYIIICKDNIRYEVKLI